MIDDVLEEGADERFLRTTVEPEFEKKTEAEKRWPTETDCDRLDAAFKALDSRGVLALQNAGYTMSDGHESAYEGLSERGWDKYFGYCFYHGQDLERAIAGHGLLIAFDHVDGEVPEKLEVGKLVKAELERAGFRCDWNADTTKRISIPVFDWKRRRSKEA